MKKRLMDLTPKQKLIRLSMDTEQIESPRRIWWEGFFYGIAFVVVVLTIVFILLVSTL